MSAAPDTRAHRRRFDSPEQEAFLSLWRTYDRLRALEDELFARHELTAQQYNALRLLRLKDKLGNRSNASAEVEFDDACGLLVAEEGRGIPTILEMGVFTRLDNAIGSAGLMRQCVSQAIHHARGRRAFKRLPSR